MALVRAAAAALMVLAGCNSADCISAIPRDCDLTEGPSAPSPEACQYIDCSLHGDDFAANGTWTYQDCTYTDASADESSQIGLPCAGALSLCADGASDGQTYVWTDIGPNGVASSTTAHATIETRNNSILAYTSATFESAGCTSDVDYVFECALVSGEAMEQDGSTWSCQKVSYLRSTSCPSQGSPGDWVKSSFTFVYMLAGC